MSHALLHEIVGRLGGELIGDPELRIDAVRPLDAATPSSISFIANPRYRSQLAQTLAGCVIVAPAWREAAAARGAAIVTDDPYLYFARLTQWWQARTRVPVQPGVHPSAWVEPSARIAPSAAVGPFAVVEAGVVVGEGASIGAHCALGADASIGAGTRLAAHVTLGAGCMIGARGVVHSGVVIGADGFGFAPNEGRWEKIAQLGAVRIGDDVEIGANTCIDRGALDDTVIEDGVKLDNLVQIGHNVHIGAHSAMAGCAAVAGSTTIGRHCTIGGAAMIGGHLRFADHVHVSGATAVSHSLLRAGQYSGVFPVDDNASWLRNAAALRQLHLLRDRIRTLERRLDDAQRERSPGANGPEPTP